LRPFAVKFLCKDRVIEGADPAKSVSFFFGPLKMYEMEKVDCGSLGARSFQTFSYFLCGEKYRLIFFFQHLKMKRWYCK
jgi:hypothetical protein